MVRQRLADTTGIEYFPSQKVASQAGEYWGTGSGWEGTWRQLKDLLTVPALRVSGKYRGGVGDFPWASIGYFGRIRASGRKEILLPDLMVGLPFDGCGRSGSCCTLDDSSDPIHVTTRGAGVQKCKLQEKIAKSPVSSLLTYVLSFLWILRFLGFRLSAVLGSVAPPVGKRGSLVANLGKRVIVQQCEAD
jgi:hypothetical protein